MDTNVPSDIERLTKQFRVGLYKYLNSLSKNKLSTKQQSVVNTNLKVFLYNCVLASTVKGSFAISLNRNTYSDAAIRNGVRLKNKLSYNYTKKILNYFESNYNINVEVGSVVEWNNYKVRGKHNTNPEFNPSIVRLSNNFTELCLSINISKETLLQINTLILRNADKEDITYLRDDTRKGEIQMLNEFNIRALETVISKNDSDDTYLLQLRKIYNESFERGGRLFDLVIQSMPKSERKRLLIDNESVKLLDYKAFETSLAYTLCESVMDGDPYMIDFEEYHPDVVRSVCKLIMTRIYNVDNEKTLIYLVNKYIHDHFNMEDLYSKGKIPEKRIPVGLFVDILKDKHDAIQEYFYNEGDMNLQYVGSQIMDYIIESVMQNHNVTVIPVFDEIICGESLVEEILLYMKKAYVSVLGSDVNCRIEVE